MIVSGIQPGRSSGVITNELSEVLHRLEGLERKYLKLAGVKGKNTNISWGGAIIGFAASKTSATTVVKHELGKTPSVVVVTSFNAPEFGRVILCNTFAYGAETFNVDAELLGPVFTGNIESAWIAIG